MEHRGSNRIKGDKLCIKGDKLCKRGDKIAKAIGLLELKRAIFQNIFSSDESQSA